jgi:acyl dehydratase
MPNVSQQAPFRSVSVSLSRADIIEFAEQFDPQPYHLDAEAAEQSIFGALCASGWQVAALTTRLLEDALIDEGLDVLYTNEVSSLRWRKPTFVDDQLALNITLQATDSSSAPTGHYHQAIEVNVVNQNQEPVAEMATVVLIRNDVKNSSPTSAASEGASS